MLNKTGQEGDNERKNSKRGKGKWEHVLEDKHHVTVKKFSCNILIMTGIKNPEPCKQQGEQATPGGTLSMETLKGMLHYLMEVVTV